MSAFAYAESVFGEWVTKHAMLPHLKKGALLGFSGGADSALLLVLLSRLATREGFSLLALHVNHGIRGEEAERDEAFCRALAERYGVPFAVSAFDVPALAKESGKGIEETAREVRYRAFEDACRANGLFAAVTAHHATDSAETVLLHLSRGTGGGGLCGIPAVRQQGEILVLRPLLGLSRAEIEAAVKEMEIPYVTDSTNADTAYRRNYIRAELLPRFGALNPSFEKAVLRMSESLAEDMDYLDGEAKRLFSALPQNSALSKKFLLGLHSAMRYRVLMLFYKRLYPDAPCPEKVHMDAFFSRLAAEGGFSSPFPGGIYADVSGDKITFLRGNEGFDHGITPIFMGENRLSDGSLLYLLEKGSCAGGANVYKLSIHRDLSSATINGGLYVRSRRDGDSYRFGGVTHKLKKLFSDAKIPSSERDRVPVLCDSEGILWVPRFGVRDDGSVNGAVKNLTLYYLPKGQI